MKDFLDEMGDNKKEYLQQLRKYRGQRIRYLSRFRLQRQGLLKVLCYSGYMVSQFVHFYGLHSSLPLSSSPPPLPPPTSPPTFSSTLSFSSN